MVPGKGISMQNKKQNKIKMQIIFATLIFMVVLVADFYAIINFSKEYILIAAITVVLLLCLWGVLNGIFALRALKEERREEQYDSIFKSEKASYLMLKKYFEELEDKIDIVQKAAKVPTEEIINAQKGIAKVVINRNRENADAIMGSNEQLMESIEAFEDKLKESNDFIIENQKNVIYENLKEISEKQQSLSDSIKEMEIRLSQAITANPIQFTANVEMPKGAKYDVLDDFAVKMPEEIQAQPAPVAEPEVTNVPDASVVDTQTENAKSLNEATLDDVTWDDIKPDEEPLIENAPQHDSIPEPEPIVEPEPVQPIAEPEPEQPEAPKAPEVDTSDPNRQLSPDEIAALFAGAQGEASEPSKEEPAAEPEPEPAQPEAPKALEVDTSDPNRQLSPDEIAALFAGAQGGASEPAKEEPAAEPEPEQPETPKAPGVDMSDPNRNLTPDEIAALIGSL